jgi:WD40 repeat protein
MRPKTDPLLCSYSSISHSSRAIFAPSVSPPTCVQWSPRRACVFATGAADGCVYVAPPNCPLRSSDFRVMFSRVAVMCTI